jgi:hypothetical protein
MRHTKVGADYMMNEHESGQVFDAVTMDGYRYIFLRTAKPGSTRLCSSSCPGSSATRRRTIPVPSDSSRWSWLLAFFYDFYTRHQSHTQYLGLTAAFVLPV